MKTIPGISFVANRRLGSATTSWRPRRVLAIVATGTLILNLSFIADAAVIEPRLPSLPDKLRFPQIFPSQGANENLREVIRLIEAGERAKARQQLGVFLAVNPRNANAQEIAGTLFLQENQLALAKETLTKAILNDSKRSSAMAKLGIVLLLQKNPTGAEIVLRKAIEVNPGESLALRYLAYLEERKGRVQSAIYYLQRLLRTDWVAEGKISETHVVLANLYERAGRNESTQALLTSLVLDKKAPDPNNQAAIALLNANIALSDAKGVERLVRHLRKDEAFNALKLQSAEAVLKRLRGDNQGALTAFQELLEKDPSNSIDYHFQIALLHRGMGDLRATVRSLDAAAKRADASQIAFVLQQLTGAHLALGRDQKALDTLEQYENTFPTVAFIPYFSAEVLAKQKKFGLAREKLDTAISRDRQFHDAHRLMGLIEWESGQAEKARRAMRKAVEANPNEVKSWLTLALMYDDHSENAAETSGSGSQHDKIVEIIDEALRANPQHPDLLYEKASVVFTAGKTKEAEGYYRAILGQVPHHIPALSNLAISMLMDPAQTGEARKLVAYGQSLSPNDAFIVEATGMLMLREGKPAQAVDLLSKVAEVRPKDGTVQYHLALAYLKDGKNGRGRAALGKALALGVPKHYREDIIAKLKAK